jgi:hypothetical protein
MAGQAKNGSMNGYNIHTISTLEYHEANVTGIVDSAITDLPSVAVPFFVHTHWDPAILFLHQYVY